MLKRGIVDGPFAKRPSLGPLPKLPSYMVGYLIIIEFANSVLTLNVL